MGELGVAGHRTEDVNGRESSHVHDGHRMGTTAKVARGKKFPATLDSSGTGTASGAG